MMTFRLLICPHTHGDRSLPKVGRTYAVTNIGDSQLLTCPHMDRHSHSARNSDLSPLTWRVPTHMAPPQHLICPTHTQRPTSDLSPLWRVGSWDDEHGNWDKKWPVSAILAFSSNLEPSTPDEKELNSLFRNEIFFKREHYSINQEANIATEPILTDLHRSRSSRHWPRSRPQRNPGCKKRSVPGNNFMKTTQLVFTVMTLFAAGANAGTQERLATYRQEIDSLDQRIVDLFQQRARLVEEVGTLKREAHLPVTVPSREQQVVEKAQELSKGGPLPAEAVGRIYQKLVEEMRNWEAKLDAAAPQSSDQPAAAGGSK